MARPLPTSSPDRMPFSPNNMTTAHVNRPVDLLEAAHDIGVEYNNPDDIDWDRLHVRGTPADFHLMPHQLADAKAMWDAESTPLPATILGNNVGLGTTSTLLAEIAMHVSHIERLAAEGKRFVARPTLLFVPANLVAPIHDYLSLSPVSF
jgi:hypothetical protein